MKYTLHPGAETDLREAAQFYKDRAGTTLAQAFFEEFERGIDVLLQHPRLGSPWRYDTRRHSLKRFPYSVIYKSSDQELRIIAVAHQSRLPGYWSKRR